MDTDKDKKPIFRRDRRYVGVKSGQYIGTGVWYDANNKVIRPGHGIYDDKKKTITQYNSDGTTTEFTRQQWALKKQRDRELQVLKNDWKYAIPYDPNRVITINIDKNSPTARAKGAVISESLLDSIAENARRANIPFRDAIGIVSRESMLGNATTGNGSRVPGESPYKWMPLLIDNINQKNRDYKSIQELNNNYKQDNKYYSPTALTSDWKQFMENADAPFAQFVYTGKGKKKPFDQQYADVNFGGAVNLYNKESPKEMSPLQHAFLRYKKNPTKYNPGDNTYPSKVESAGNELVLYSPEIRNYMKKHNIHDNGGYLLLPDIANTFANGGRLKRDNILPTVRVTAKYPHEQRVIDTMNSSNAEFMNRLRNNDRRAINNPNGSKSTHVLGSADNIVFPAIQDVDGRLTDYRNLPIRQQIQKAIDNKDYIEFPTEGDARYFGEHYKKYFPEYFSNQYADGGELQNYDNTVESREEMPEEQSTTILPWDELSMSEKADIMNRALERDIISLKDIRDSYNSGVLSQEAENTQEPENIDNIDYYPDYLENYPNQGNIYASGGKMQGNSKAQRAMNFFMSKGLTKQQAAGIVGNLERESNLNPNAFNSAGGGHGAYGIAQWRGDRQTNLFRKYGSNPSFEDQLNYVWDELNSTHKRGLQKIRASKTADEAARNAFGYYEFSGGVDSAIADMNRHRAGNMSGIDALNRGIKYAQSSYDGDPSGGLSDFTSSSSGYSSLSNDDNSNIGITVPKVVIPKDFYDEKPKEEEKPKSYDAIAELRELMSTLGNKNYTSSALDALNPYYSTQEEGVPDIDYQSSPWDAIGRLKELMGNRVSDNFTSNASDNVFPQMMGNSHMFGPGGKVPKRMPDNFGIDLQKEMNSYGIQPTDNTYVGNTNVPVVVSKREAARLAKQNRRPSTGKKFKNSQLERRTIEGAKHNAEFERNHPALTAWGNLLGTAPLVVAAAPFAAAAGEALGGTTVGSAILGGINMIKNAPLVKTLLPWADAAVTSYFGADGINDVRNGEVTPETVLELAPMTRVGKGIIRAGKSISFPKKFTSELDWTPESWFGTRIKGTYDTDDVAALNAHIPEYHAIEKAAKRNGTWLKMPDSSTWEGDPRSWVQLQSKDGKKLMQKPFYHGERNYHKDINDNIITIDATPESLGENIIWTSSNKYLPYTYSDDHYVFSIPKNTRIVGIDAKGRNWNKLKDLNLGYEDTNDVAKDLLSNDNVVEIKNVIDMGDNARMWSEMNKLPKYLPNEKMYQYLNRVFKGDDYVLGKDVPRKSLLGNNGNFDFTKPNIYKSLIPIGIPFGIEYLSSNKK